MENGYAVIDYGRTSGKHSFAISIGKNKTKLINQAIENGYKKTDVITVTPEEFKYLQKVTDCIEVLFNGERRNKTKNRFFY